jgi:hypothetical protein
VLGNNIFVISGVNVANGGLFNRASSRAYDVVVVGFDEYVTDMKHNQYLKLVQDGGEIVFLIVANFLGRVNYRPVTKGASLWKIVLTNLT